MQHNVGADFDYEQTAGTYEHTSFSNPGSYAHVISDRRSDKQVRSAKLLWLCLSYARTSEAVGDELSLSRIVLGRSGGIGSIFDVVPDHCGEEGAAWKVKLLIFGSFICQR